MIPAIIQVTPNLWVQQSELYSTNAGLFASSGQGVLIDPCIYEREIVAWRDFAAENNTQVSHLILTHSHWDHIFGPEYYPELPIVAQAEYLEMTRAGKEGRALRNISNWFAEQNISREQPFVIPQPDHTFGERLSLPVGDEMLELVHAPGHAADQLVIYHAASRLLWASDILSDLEIPYVIHSLAAFEQTLAMLAEWEIEVLVPGHGSVAQTSQEVGQRIQEDRAYLAEVRGRVSQAISQGKSLEETAALCSDMVYRHQEDNEVPHQRNIESAYMELGGAADPKKVGWSQFD